jgi:hypothetical protein
VIEGLRLIDSGVARAWLEDSLGAGGSLSRLFKASRDLDTGTIRAILPPGEDADHPERGFGTRAASTALLYTFLRAECEPDAQFVVEDELLRRSDYHDVNKFGTPVVFNEDEVFHVQHLGAFGESAALEDFLNWSSAGYPLNGFIVGVGDLDLARSGSEINQAVLERLAKAIRCAIVGAYDSDGFLLWLPKSGNQDGRDGEDND